MMESKARATFARQLGLRLKLSQHRIIKGLLPSVEVGRVLGCHLPLIECPENESIAFRYPEIGREDEDKRAQAMSEVEQGRRVKTSCF